MTVYKIISVDPSQGLARSEYIDTKKNVLFQRAKSGKDVKRIYESFWGGNTRVSDVIKAKVKSQGSNWGIKSRKLKKVM